MKHKYSFKWIHVISIVLAIFVTWISCPIYASNPLISAETSSVEWYEKVDPLVYEKADKKGEEFLVYIFRDDISTEKINEIVTKETRFDASLYETEKFESCVVPELERQIVSYEQINQMQSLVTNHVLGKPSTLTINKAKQIEMNNYIMARRDVIKELNTKNNDKFVSNYIDDTSNIVYRSQYTSTIIAYLTKEEIEACARSEDVVAIAPHESSVEVIENAIVFEQIGVDSSSGTKSNQYNSGNGYRGDGVKIGIIEAEGGICDTTHPQLSNLSETLTVMDNVREDGSLVSSQITAHATCVTALIVGQRIEVNGKVFEGVVPDATVYQIPAITSPDVLKAIQILAAEGVTVINYSGGSNLGLGAYMPYDQEVDKLIDSLEITFVVSAGNNGTDSNNDNSMTVMPAPPYVSSPGKAYNAITVGNVKTKDDGLAINPPYSMHYSSSYVVNDFISNKPDISAPGSELEIMYSWSSSVSATGTSFSAPLATGVVAQLHEANVNLIKNPTATKAILLAGADFDAISATDNEYWAYCSAARVKSGVGFLNAERSVRIAEAGNYQHSKLFMNTPSRYVGYSSLCAIVDVPANSKVRIVMTYNKPADLENGVDFVHDNRMDLDFADQRDCYSWFSWAPYNNVEVIECVVDVAGMYTIEVYVDEMTQTSTRVLMDRSIAWYIEPAS